MQFTFRPMSEQAAQAIARWKYDGPYSFYNMENDPDDLAELLEPQNWLGRFYEAMDESVDPLNYKYEEMRGAHGAGIDNWAWLFAGASLVGAPANA